MARFLLFTFHSNIEEWIRNQFEVGYSRLPGSDPGLGVHLQATSPLAVLLWALRQEPALHSQLLSYSTDVVGLEPTAASNEEDSCIVGLSGILLHVPAGQYSGLQSCRTDKQCS